MVTGFSYPHVSGTVALKQMFRLGRSYSQFWKIYIVNVRVCTEDQLSQQEKIENVQENYNKNCWNTQENV